MMRLCAAWRRGGVAVCAARTAGRQNVSRWHFVFRPQQSNQRSGFSNPARRTTQTPHLLALDLSQPACDKVGDRVDAATHCDRADHPHDAIWERSLLLDMLGVFAEFETNLRRER